MAATSLSVIESYMNDELIKIEPNSFMYDLGNPEITVRPQVSGNNIENVYTKNFETAKSKFSFDLATTSENESRILDWIDNFSANVFRAVSTDGITRVFQQCALINKPEFNTGSDGVVSVEFESLPAVVA